MNTTVTVLKHLIPALQAIQQDLQQELQRKPRETAAPAATPPERPVQPPMERRKGLLTVAAASEFLSMSTGWVYKMASTGQIPHHKLGSRLLFSEDKLLEWLEANSARRCRRNR